MLLRDATDADAPDVARIMLAARATAMPWLVSPHTDDEVRGWIATTLVPGGGVVVATLDGQRVTGFAGLADGWLHHLYIDPAHQGHQHGSALLDEAKIRQPAGLQLWAFQRNTPALEFYARRGFSEVERTDGRANEEREPDVRMEWRP